MSFSLNISGHHGDANVHDVENMIRGKAREIRDELEGFGITASFNFAGSSGSGIDADTSEVEGDGTGEALPPAEDGDGERTAGEDPGPEAADG
jgi:hypothetical protein